ncbi:MAG: hypothetical protein ABII71_02285 [Candidatus Micrarchaeota archaeon]
MIELILKTVAGGITEAVKLTTEAALLKVEATMEEARVEFKEMLSVGLYSTQMMLLETILIGFLFVIGFFYVGAGLTVIIDMYAGIPGTGSTIFGILFLLFGYALLQKSRKRIKAIKEI